MRAAGKYYEENMKMFGELRLVRALTDEQIAAMRAASPSWSPGSNMAAAPVPSRVSASPPVRATTIGAPAARFYLNHRSELFPDAPLVVGALDERLVTGGVDHELEREPLRIVQEH